MASQLDEEVGDVCDAKDNELGVLLREVVNVVDNLVYGRATTTLTVQRSFEPNKMTSLPRTCEA